MNTWHFSTLTSILMELHLPFFPTICPLFLLLFILFKTIRRSRANYQNRKLPPGPPKLPVIGNLHQLGGSLLHHTLRDLAKEHGPLMHLRLGEVSTIVVSSPEIAKEVLKAHDVFFAQRPQLLSSKIMSYDCADIGSAPYGNHWIKLRKICTMELLSPDRVQSFKSIREEEVLNLIRTIHSSEGSPINLSEEIFSLTHCITLQSALGRRCKAKDALLNVFTELKLLSSGLSIADMYPSIKVLQYIGGLRIDLEKLHEEADRVLQEIVDEHRAKRSTTIHEREAEDDLVDVLLNIQDRGDLELPLSDNTIKAVLLEMFTAGSETTSTTLEWAMSELLKNPRAMKEAQAEVRCVFQGKENVDESLIHELEFLNSVIQETLRLHPPFPLLLPRESRESCEILGYEIPAKTRLIVNAWQIGRDPKCWPKPTRFYPERFLFSSVDYKGTNFEFIPFGAGRRVCPGISFALANIELPLAQLLFHFDWTLPNGTLDMSEADGLVARRKEDLVLIPTAHQ